ncbi:fructose biphosphate aldolase, putative [Leishmania tarentolae]|uniref:fructose-bisphosphate aldolase n=1 Tax=Leishmania tarentolae TaxID=5689 RepID=A0A640K945_LEITA|nr:fructose biphosphate aldolase, putative [Leishmania tarentolae]
MRRGLETLTRMRSSSGRTSRTPCNAPSKPMGLENTLKNHRKCSVIMLETEGLSRYVGGVILRKETAKNCCSEMMFTGILWKNRMVLDMSVEGKWHPLYEGAAGEEITANMDGTWKACSTTTSSVAVSVNGATRSKSRLGTCLSR